MLSISHPDLSFENGEWQAKCSCGKVSQFAFKSSALKMIERGTCRNCRINYRPVEDNRLSIYRREDGKWCSTCSGCGIEQAYTRKEHAKQSDLSDWQCKSCVAKAKGFSANQPVGSRQRLFNKFMKSAKDRGIDWDLSLDDMFSSFDGKCSLTGWPIGIDYDEQTASLDRIDSSLGYHKDNIQWVHTMINMAKNKYTQDQFLKMCLAVADKIKW
jgi:hypothetical protein